MNVSMRVRTNRAFAGSWQGRNSTTFRLTGGLGKFVWHGSDIVQSGDDTRNQDTPKWN